MMSQISGPVLMRYNERSQPGRYIISGNGRSFATGQQTGQTKYIIKKGNRKKKDETGAWANTPKEYTACFYEYSFVKLILTGKFMKKLKFDSIDALPAFFLIEMLVSLVIIFFSMA